MRRFKSLGSKPSRDRLWGMSPSQFKTLLKRRGFKVSKDFFKYDCIAEKGNRLYRFRWWAWPDFLVDISCPKTDFDRWANSVDQVINFYNFLGIYDVEG